MKEPRWIEEDRGYETPCWIWQLAVRSNGYGVTNVPGEYRQTTAHRLAYIQAFGPIADDLVVDHLCRVRSCVNPAHLEPVTPRENTLRGVGPPAINAAKTHCPQGHPYDEVNTYVKPDGRRVCRTCKLEQQRERRAKEQIKRALEQAA